MSLRYLLDTNVVSDFVKGHAAVQRRLRATSPAEIAVSSVTVIEVDCGLGLDPNRRRRLQPMIEALLGAITVLPFGMEDARAAGAVRAALRRAGRPIGPYDILLAGSALARGLTLVTGNTSEFHRVVGLLVEDWREG